MPVDLTSTWLFRAGQSNGLWGALWGSLGVGPHNSGVRGLLGEHGDGAVSIRKLLDYFPTVSQGTLSIPGSKPYLNVLWCCATSTAET